MENPEHPHAEDFAQALAALKKEYQVNDSEVARRIGVSPATVNTWVHRKRTPRADAIRTLAAAFPKFPEERLFAAAGRKAPGPVSPDTAERLLALFRELTEEQQRMKEIEMRALRDSNQSA